MPIIHCPVKEITKKKNIRSVRKVVLFHSTFDKCFTYVTKTIAILTTYSRKPGDYNGTVIFEIDIMKNSSPLNLKFTSFVTVKTKITLLFCWTHSTFSLASE